MNLSEEFVRDLVSSSVPNAQYKSHKPVCLFFTNAGDFTQNSDQLYYGVFNIGTLGSLSYSLRTSPVIEHTLTTQESAILQPVLFDDIIPVNCSFTGIKIQIAGNV